MYTDFNAKGIAMKQDLLVGRSAEIEKLKKILVQGWNQQGNVVFIAGTAGMGKSTLLDMMREEAKSIPELAQTTFATGNCNQIVGPQNAFQPFIHTLEDLTRKDEPRKSIANLVVTILKETAPDWLQMIPTFGAALAAGAKTVTITAQWILDRNDSKSQTKADSLAAQYTNTLVKIASNQYFLTLIIEDAHWIDDSSCQLLFYLAQKIVNQRLVIIVTYRPDFVGEEHPLHKVQGELRSKGLTQLIELKGLTKEQINTYVSSRFGNRLHPMLSDWLENLCSGNPLFVTQYLSLLEEKKIIHREGGNYLLDGDISKSSEGWQTSGSLADVPVPERIEEVLKQRIERLLEEERKLLQLGSVQGDFFMSAVLAQELTKDEFDILDQLNQLVEKYAIITLYDGSEWFQKFSDSYSFEHHLIQQAFYNKLSPRQRVLMHHKTAEILENIWKQPRYSSRGLALEVAHHYSQGDEPLLAAQYYFFAAQSSFSDGAFVETITLCKKVLEHLKQIDNQDRMTAEVIQLLLISSETRWRGKAELQGDLPLNELAQQAEQAASRTGDLTLLIQTKYLRALVVLATEGRERCIDILKEALQAAQQAGDPLNEFVVTAELGHQTRGDNQANGLALLYHASDLYQQMTTNAVVPPNKQVERYYRRFQVLLGLAEFDAGHYDKAEQWFNDGINGFKQLGMFDELPRAFSFLSQLYMGTGLFEQAEQVLIEAVNLLKDEQAPNPYKGYNLALLGKLYLEWEQVNKAAEPLVKGWEETQATWHVSMVPLVRNYYAELLMHPDYPERNLDAAQRLLATTVDEAQAAGFHRSAIAALSLEGKLALEEGRNVDGVDYSTQAVQYLERLGGTLPALRTEEVWFTHYMILQAVKRDSEALDYLKRAFTVVQEKAGSLQSEDHRRAFLERVPLSRAILAAYKQKG